MIPYFETSISLKTEIDGNFSYNAIREQWKIQILYLSAVSRTRIGALELGCSFEACSTSAVRNPAEFADASPRAKIKFES